MKHLEQAEIVERLQQGQSVRVGCGNSSVLRLDRPLPFLCVYRTPAHRDEGTRTLITNEASYLLVGADDDAVSLMTPVVEALYAKFEAFLVLEVSAGEPPDFTIKTGREVRARRLGVKLSEFLRRATRDPIELSDRRPGLQLDERVVHLKLEVPTFFQSPEGYAFPLVLRRFRRRLTRAVRKLFHHFILTSTPLKVANFQTLGPRAMVKLVWEVDEALEELSRSFSFLLQITPTNVEQSWRQFKKDEYSKTPEFVYRPFPADPTQLKRRLFSIPIERVEDATLHHIFLEKQRQLELKISMAERRRTPDFLYGSLSLYGPVESELKAQAEALLDHLPRHCPEPESGLMKAEEFATLARREVAFYRSQWDGFTPRVEVRPDLEGSVLCDDGNLLIGARAEVAVARAAPLIHHEVGTHLVTYYNGRAQRLRQLSLGLADYLELQEGLAVLSEFLTGPLSRRRMQMLALRVLAVDLMLSGADFVETFAELRERCKIPQRIIYGLVVRVFRGGGLTKDAVYFRGLAALLEALSRGQDLEALFVGKIANHHVPLIKELQWRKVLVPAPLKPRVLSIPEAQRRLQKLRQGCSVIDLCQIEQPESSES